MMSLHNDINVLQRSPMFVDLLISFSNLSYGTNGHQYTKGYLSNVIYPR
jgi:hypothetical protein